MLSTFATFGTYVAVGGTLTAAKVFSIASIFASGRVVMSLFLPHAILIGNEALVAIDRVQELLFMELNFAGGGGGGPTADAATASSGLCVKSLSAAWPDPPEDPPEESDSGAGQARKKEPPAAGDAEVTARWRGFSNVSLNVDFGQIALVMGPVGAGKTTMLMSILGELENKEGSTISTGGAPVLYCPQTAWVFPGTIQENIIFL